MSRVFAVIESTKDFNFTNMKPLKRISSAMYAAI